MNIDALEFQLRKNRGWAHLRQWNLIVAGDWTTNSEVELRVAVGGRVTSSWANIGVHLPRDHEGDGAWIGGDVVGSGLRVMAGNLRLGGAARASIELQGTASRERIGDAEVAPRVRQMVGELSDLSALLSQLAATSEVQLPEAQPAEVTLRAVPNAFGLAVICVGAEELLGNDKVQAIKLEANGADAVIINLSGAEVQWRHGNLTAGFDNHFGKSCVLWNFHEAVALDLGSRQMKGAVLAPGAAARHQGTLDGSVVVARLESMSEVHKPTWSGPFQPTPPTPDPDPAAEGEEPPAPEPTVE